MDIGKISLGAYHLTPSAFTDGFFANGISEAKLKSAGGGPPPPASFEHTPT